MGSPKASFLLAFKNTVQNNLFFVQLFCIAIYYFVLYKQICLYIKNKSREVSLNSTRGDYKPLRLGGNFLFLAI